MKKIYAVIISALILAQPASAGLVTPETAARCAGSVLGVKDMPLPDNSGSMRAGARNGEASYPEYYVCNKPGGGWVIIAADDRVNPVIAYSDRGTFNTANMPDNLKWWMEGVSEGIDLVRESDFEASGKIKDAWQRLLGGGTPSGETKVLETALWNQEAPYNQYCPVINGELEHALTGCVATALSIVMRFNKWPEHGKGVIGGYTTSSYKTYIPAYSIDDHYYDWDNMPLTDGTQKASGWTDEQKHEVAQLVHDCGVAVEMDYSSRSSAATSNMAINALKNHMSYAQSAVLLSRSSYSLEEWYAMLRSEIDHGRVTYYGGTGDAGGHAFVCDGYDTDGEKLHFNWGWSEPDANGFYSLDLTLPSKYKFSFPDFQDAIIGIVPDTTHISVSEKSALVCVPNRGLYGLEPITPADLVIGSEFEFVVGWIYNNTDNDLNLEFKVCLEDKDGNVKQEGWNMEMEAEALKGYLYYKYTDKTTLTVSPEFTDIFKLYYREKGGSSWTPMPGNHDVLPDVDYVRCGVIQDPYIIVPDGIGADEPFKPSLSLGFTPIESTEWSLNGTAADDENIVLKPGKNVIRADVRYLDGSTGYINRTIWIK